jgi:hypothetical protein
MLRAVSTYLFVKERLHPGILDGLTRSGTRRGSARQYRIHRSRGAN